MAKSKKDNDSVEVVENTKTVTPNDLEWTDYVLGFLSEDEKIAGNPTTDGLRRIFEKVLNCVVISADFVVEQSPNIKNEGELLWFIP